jgi:hypothetical protein
MLRKPELAALLAYAGDTTSNNVVKFRIGNSGQLIASATDGKRALEGRGVAENAEAGEWAIERTTMEACRRILDDGDTVVCLKVTPKGCKKFQILGAASGDVQGTYEIPSGEVSTQVSMDAIHDLISDQGESLLEGSWFAVNPGYLSDLHVVSKAADKCPVSIYPPRDPLAPVRFEARSSEGHWRGVIMPVPVVAPGDEAAPADGEERPPGAPETPGPLKLEPELSTQKKRRPKATAPAKKKKATKKPKGAAAAAAASEPEEDEDEASGEDSGVVDNDYDPTAPKAKGRKGAAK